jgi:hypothetical protein
VPWDMPLYLKTKEDKSAMGAVTRRLADGTGESDGLMLICSESEGVGVYRSYKYFMRVSRTSEPPSD